MGNFTHLGLFEGIGGFSLAARWMSWETVAWCEWDKNCQRVLKYHFPNANAHDDITKTDFTRYAEQIDILTGGFPCQPYSTAGKRLGKDDDRHLWPEMLRAIREVRPVWVVGENVRGLISWNGGLVFDEVQTDLEAEGYEVLPFILPACAVDAPHRRDRVWFIAYSCNNGSHGTKNRQSMGKGNDSNKTRQNKAFKFEGRSFQDAGPTKNTIQVRRDSEQPESQPGERQQWHFGAGNDVRVSDAANAQKAEREQSSRTWEGRNGFTDVYSEVTSNANKIERPERWMHADRSGKAERHTGTRDSWNDRGAWQHFPTQSPVCSRNDGFPGGLDGITFSKWREFSIGAYGNAIVPQVAYQIFKAVEQWEISKAGQPTK